jgi:hypothetical protein
MPTLTENQTQDPSTDPSTQTQDNQSQQSHPEAHWLDDYEAITAEDRKALQKYKTPEEALLGGVNAMRLIGKSVRLPDEKTSPQERAKFDQQIATYMGVPNQANDYKFERPTLPAGLPYDEDSEKWFRDTAHKAKLPQGAATALYNAWNERQIAAHQARFQEMQKAEEQLKREWAAEWEVKLGVPGDSKRIGTVKQAIMQISQNLGLDYNDEQGNPQSRLIDDLEFNRPAGCLGDKTTILKVFDWIYENCFAEGKTPPGAPVPGREGAFWPNFYAHPDTDKVQ